MRFFRDNLLLLTLCVMVGIATLDSKIVLAGGDPSIKDSKVKKQKSLKYIRGIANLGYRPTFNEKKILLEVHLFNFSGNLYNKHLTVEVLKFIRSEKKFKNVDQLKKQIKIDLLIAKKIKWVKQT